MSSKSSELVLNPLTGRYVKKYSAGWNRLIAEGVISDGDTGAVVPSTNTTGTYKKKTAQRLVNEIAEIAEEKRPVISGMSREEIDNLISAALYERLIHRGPSKKQQAKPIGVGPRPVTLAQPKLAPKPPTMKSAEALRDAGLYGSDDDSDEEGDVSVSSADIETTTAAESESDVSSDTPPIPTPKLVRQTGEYKQWQQKKPEVSAQQATPAASVPYSISTPAAKAALAKWPSLRASGAAALKLPQTAQPVKAS